MLTVSVSLFARRLELEECACIRELSLGSNSCMVTNNCPRTGICGLLPAILRRCRWVIIQRALKALGKSEQSLMRERRLPSACSGIFGSHVHGSTVSKTRKIPQCV